MATLEKKETKPKSENVKKLFVLDTNVLLHDPNSIEKFQEHDINIPSVVLEELDDKKKGNDTINANAREFNRKLRILRQKKIKKVFKCGKVDVEKMVPALSHGGVSIGDGLGNIEIIRISKNLHPFVKAQFFHNTPDNWILSTVLELEEEEMKHQKRRVIFVTKDFNLQEKADLIGIEVQDYENDKVPNPDNLYLGRGEIDDVRLSELIDQLHVSEAKIFDEEYSDCINKETIKPNMFFVLKSGNQSCLARVDKNMEYFHKIEKKPVFGIMPRNSEQAFSVDALLQEDIKLVTLMGKAGTGKTLFAMAAAIQQLKDGKYDNIVISAAMVPLSNKDIGAVPGNVQEKVSPYMQGIYDNLALIQSQNKGKRVSSDSTISESRTSSKKRKSNPKPSLGEEKTDYISYLQREEKIKIQPLASIRGRSINNTVFIIDEAQNLTPHEVKTIITRAGENTKIVFCGDIQQIDSPYLDARSNGLSNIVYHLGGKKLVAHVTLEKGERSELAELAADLL